MHSTDCISEKLLREALLNITAAKSEMEHCAQMQLFAAFMIVVALYDIAMSVRRFFSAQAARAGRVY